MIRKIGISTACLALAAPLLAAAPQGSTSAGVRVNGTAANRSAEMTTELTLTGDHFKTRAFARYKHKKNRIYVWRGPEVGRRKPVVAYKLKRSAGWRKAGRCWAPHKNEISSCGVRKFRGNRIPENKKIYWRLCVGLYAKKKKDQHINFGPRWCTGAYYFRK